MLQYVLRRIALLPLQVFAVLAFTFVLSRMAKQSPAYWMAGPYANKETVQTITKQLGLDQPLYVQFWIYLQQIAHGNFGVSLITGRPALSDVLDRLPATLELITTSLILVVILGVPLGILTAVRSNRVASTMTTGYGLFSGSFPDFVIGLLLVYVFFVLLGWAPAPVTRIDPGIDAPTHITGFYVLDSILTGNWPALQSSVAHLILPVLTMVIVYMGGVLKIARSSVREVTSSEMAFFARACGLPARATRAYILRNSLAPIITITGITYGFLIGAAVLVERVYGWGGVGLYSVQAISFSDYAALQLFVVFATVFSLLIYLIVDILLVMVDRRIRF